MKKILLMLMVCMIGAAAWADFATTPHLAGEFNSWDAGANPMTDMGGGIFSLSISGLLAGQRQEFKITDGTWDSNFPGPNSWYYADADGNITVTFNTNDVSDGWAPSQYRLGLSVDPGAWTVAGSFQGWDNANPATAMTDMGGGIYMLSQSLDAGDYWWKAVVTGTWDSISWDNRSVGTGDWGFSLTETSTVNFYVDALTGVARYEVIPEPATMALLGLGALLTIRRKK